MVLSEQVSLLRDLVGGLSDADLIAPSGCRGWRVADLVVHLRLGAESILVGLSSWSGDRPDRDFISYWRDWPARGEATFTDVRFTWASTAAYSSGEGVRRHFDDVANAVEAAVVGPLEGRRRFQGHVLEVTDFLTIWAVEFALHYIDLTAHLADRPGPSRRGLEIAATTFDGLLGSERPLAWDLPTYVLKASGREALTDQDVTVLGSSASLYPVMG